ncbi:glycosyltransferase family 4 protein [Kaistella sp. 97-N-M2]|uniref:glycosyltransferase family 4 protein n=1 Tax=Kaistella sp. 97-N-M2 TaxID=2908645 RepID=UPI001F204648|nr:glycosyltransferase family 4 protein [Kaistella sp. 97-N-M2]UJF28776.1 glycosyltransferase family 4 protein [Kaistella sp. 97-N-M2]
MKLLYITNGISGSGGLERVLSVKASMLAEDLGYEVHMLSLNEIAKDPFFPFSKKIRFHSVEVGGNPVTYLLQYKNSLQKKIDQIQPGIISVCDDALKGFFLPGFISTKAKWIHESHASLLLADRGKGVSLFKKAQHRLKQVLGKRFTKIVLLTEGNKKEWHLKNLAVIPNPIPFESNQVSSLENKKVMAVGSYSYNKGYDLLLQIWSKAEKNFPAWELHIYGKGTHDHLHSTAKDLNLKNIHFHAPVLDIEKEYLNSSLLVLPSRSEGFGMVLIEAMGCGLPVVSFDCPSGPADIITDGEDGFLIENGNMEMFAKQVSVLMNDDQLRKGMGAKAKKNVQRFSAGKIVQQWDALFRSLG